MAIPDIPGPNPPGWTPITPAVTVAEFDAVMQSHPVVVVHLWAIWNGHDRGADERLQPYREHFAGRIHFRAFDVDNDPEEQDFPISRRVQWLNLPAFACFLHGRHHATEIALIARPNCGEKLREWAALGEAGR